MIGLFSALKSGLLKASEVNVDNTVCKLHYRVTVVLLLAFSILVTSRQYIGDPIECMTGANIPNRVLDNFCWISSTFTLPHAHGKRVGVDVPHPGIDKHRPGDDRIFHQYYQWVCFMLFLQAIMFYVPHYLWKIWEGGRMRDLVSGLKSPVVAQEDKERKEQLLVVYFANNFNNHNPYFFRFVVCEVLNLVNVIGQIYFTNRFLGGEFMTYGTDVIRFTETNQENRTDPMIQVFPRVTKCIFHTFGHSGDVQKHDALCILPINVINEKIYVFLWFWFILLTAVTSVAVAYRLFLIAFPNVHFLLLNMHTRIQTSQIGVIIHKSKIGDWFLLYQMSKNMDRLTYLEFLKMLDVELDRKKMVGVNGIDCSKEKTNNHGV